MIPVLGALLAFPISGATSGPIFKAISGKRLAFSLGISRFTIESYSILIIIVKVASFLLQYWSRSKSTENRIATSLSHFSVSHTPTAGKDHWSLGEPESRWMQQ